MGRRHSINIDGFAHANPVPAACRIGNIIYSGAITGRDPVTKQMPADLDTQCRNMFSHLRAILTAADASLDDVIRVTVHLRDFRDRAALNREWEATFPDADDRPARQALPAALDGDMRIQCDFVAVVGDPA